MSGKDSAPIEDGIAFDLSDIFIFLWQKKFRIIITTVILAGLGSYQILQLPKYYTAYSTLMMGSDQKLNVLENYNPFDYGDSMMDTYIEFMRSTQYAKAVVDKEMLHKTAEFRMPENVSAQTQHAHAVSVFQRNLTLSRLGETDLLRVSYTSLRPETAMRVANAVGPVFFQFYENRNKERANDASSWLNSQLRQLEQELARAETELQDFVDENNILDVESDIDITLTEITALLSEKLMNDKALASLEKAKQAANMAGTDVQALMGIQWFMQNPLVVDIRNRILLQEQQLEQISKRYKYKHPKHIAVTGQLQALKAEQKSLFQQLNNNLQQQFDNQKDRQQQLLAKIQSLKSQHSEMGKYELKLVKLKREVEITQKMYESFMTRLQENEIVKDLGNKDEFAMVDYASQPTVPSKPRVSLLIVMVGVFAFLFSAVFWFVIHVISDRASRTRQLMVNMGIPILTEIPKLTNSQANKAMTAAVRGEIGEYHFSESIRSLRTSAMVSSDGREKRVIVVTGVGNASGKSTVGINLAVSFGKLEKTLLLDVNLRSPVIGDTFGLDDDHPGIMEFISRKVKFSDCLHRQLDSKLFVVPGGSSPNDPMVYLSHSRFASLLQKLSVLYERVIIDAPSLSTFSDALILSKHADGVILVCDPDNTEREDLLQAIQKLRETGAPIMGVVLNKVKNMNKHANSTSRFRQVVDRVKGS